jgi:hypothetical protein
MQQIFRLRFFYGTSQNHNIDGMIGVTEPENNGMQRAAALDAAGTIACQSTLYRGWFCGGLANEQVLETPCRDRHKSRLAWLSLKDEKRHLVLYCDNKKALTTVIPSTAATGRGLVSTTELTRKKHRVRINEIQNENTVAYRKP